MRNCVKLVVMVAILLTMQFSVSSASEEETVLPSFFDDFQTSSGLFNNFETLQAKGTRSDSGEYIIVTHNRNVWQTLSRHFNDYYAEVELRFDEGLREPRYTIGGLIFGHQGEVGSPDEFFYLLTVSQSRTAMVSRYAKGRLTVISTRSGDFIDSWKSNRLSVLKTGNTWFCYVNGRLILKYGLFDIQPGSLGLYANPGTVAIFDNFAVAEGNFESKELPVLTIPIDL